MSHKTKNSYEIATGDIQCVCGRVYNVDGLGFCRHCVDKM